MNDCLFCKIIKGDIPAKKIYEDDQIFVFLDIDPLTNGHMLVIPKEHKATLLNMDCNTLTHMIEVIQTKLFPLLQEKLAIDGLTILQNNFYGQEVKHFHIHLVPRYQDDKIGMSKNQSLLKAVDSIYQQLQANENN